METKDQGPFKELIQKGEEGIILLEQLISKPQDVIPKRAIWRKAFRHPSSVTIKETVIIAAVSGLTVEDILDLLCRWVLADPNELTSVLLGKIKRRDIVAD